MNKATANIEITDRVEDEQNLIKFPQELEKHKSRLRWSRKQLTPNKIPLIENVKEKKKEKKIQSGKDKAINQPLHINITSWNFNHKKKYKKNPKEILKTNQKIRCRFNH